MKKRNAMDRSMVFYIVRSVCIDVVVMGIYGAAVGALVAFFGGFSYKTSCAVGTIVCEIVVLRTLYGRLKVYWYS